jgi:hypothetical protein
MTRTDYLYDSRLDAFENFAQMKMSGKLRLVSDEGGEWIATWKLSLGSDTITVIGHGKGIYEGLELHWFLKGVFVNLLSIVDYTTPTTTPAISPAAIPTYSPTGVSTPTLSAVPTITLTIIEDNRKLWIIWSY